MAKAVSYTRLLKKGMSGDDVRYIKDCLFSLGQYASSVKKISNNTFGSDTETAVRKYQKSHKDTDGKALGVDGIVGKKTWNAIVRDYNNKNKDIVFTRNLKEGMSGEDVFYMKKCLFTIKCYKDSIKSISNKTFGSDTVAAVKKFQQAKKLKVNGIIDKITWDAIVDAVKHKEIIPSTDPVYITKKECPGLTDATINTLNKLWKDVSATRIALMKLCLAQAYDMNNLYKSGQNLTCLYIIGADLYTTNLALFHPTVNYINQRAKAKPDFFTDGRKEFMISQLKKNGNLSATDCSGMIVGCMRKLGLVAKTFDNTADTLASKTYSTAISASALKPGDWVHKSGHIGVYLGAGLVVEAAGGAYGVQVTHLSDRRCRNIMNGKLDSMAPWKNYRRPKFY